MAAEHLSVQDIFHLQKSKSLELRTQPVYERKRELKRLSTFLLEQRERIKEAIHQDFKKPHTEIDVTEIYPVITEIRHTLRHLDEWTEPTRVDAPLTYIGTRSEIRYEPKGVCLIISPWNFPFNLCFGPLVSCLAAGNTAIIKPSELTPHTSALIADLVREFFTPDKVTVLQGDQSMATALLQLPFDHIFFTGSPAVGKIVMRAAAENLASVTLELGGKSPAIVDETASLSQAAERIAFGKFLNNGQTCIAPDYVLIHESVQSRFIELLKEKATTLFGSSNAITEGSDGYARIVNNKHFMRVQQLIEDAVQKGAKAEWRGTANNQTNFIHPVILSNIPANAQLMEEEIFGPVLPVISYQTTEEAISIINRKPKPLALYIFSRDREREETILQQTSAGSVCLNDCIIQFTHPGLPFGGVNNSGIGKAHGHFGFLAFSNEKPVLRQSRLFSMAGLLHPPYTSNLKKLVDWMMKWF